MPRRTLPFLVLLFLALLVPANATHRKEARVPAPAAQVDHVFWIWFENREVTTITSATAPTFDNFANTYARLTNFFGVEHPSQPNYLDAASGSDQGATDDAHHTITANGDDNLARQLVTAGKSWRAYMQDYPGSCSDVDTFTGGVDGAGVAGQYVRKHNHVISFESIRLDAAQCANIQPLASFDPTVNFAFIVPNMTNDMHDGTTAQGDAFLNAFLPLITAGPDWAHTLVIVTFDEGSTSLNGGGHIYTAAGAPWLSGVTVTPTYNHFSMLRTVEQIFGLPFLGAAASAATINEILPLGTTAAGVSVSGRVLTRDGSAVRTARVVLRDLGGKPRAATTNGAGYYRFENVRSGASYLMTVEERRLRFDARALTVRDQLTEVNFIAR